MASPLAIFRKKTFMVFILGLAMFAFVVLGALEASPTGGAEMFPAILGALIGMGIGWSLFQGTKFMWGGIAVAGVLGIVGANFFSRQAGPEPVVTSTAGDLTEQELFELMRQRSQANTFINGIMQKTNSRFPDMADDPRYRVGSREIYLLRDNTGRGVNERDVFFGYLLRKEAEQMGMELPDEAVSEFINEITNNRWSKQDAYEICKGLGVTDQEIYDAIRAELTAQQALFLLSPRVSSSPEVVWDLYRRLNLKQSMDLVPLSVASFTPKVKEPSDKQLLAMFNEYKTVFPEERGAGEPGFRQPDRVSVGYLEADYKQFTKYVDPVTDEEVVAFYEANKETRYKNNPFPEDFSNEFNLDSMNGGPGGPMAPPMQFPFRPPEDEEGTGTTVPETDDAATTDESSDASNTSAEDAGKSDTAADDAGKSDTAAEDAGKSDTAADDAAGSDQDNSAPETKKAEEAPKEGDSESEGTDESTSFRMPAVKQTGVGLANIADEAVLQEEQEDDSSEGSENEGEGTKEETPAKDASSEGETETDDAGDPTVKDAEATSEGEGEPEMEITGFPPPPPMPRIDFDVPEYRPLNESLKQEIREELLNDRVTAEIDSRMNRAVEKLAPLAQDYMLPPDDEERTTPEEFRDAARAIARELDLRAAETPLYSQEELLNSEDHPIADAGPPGDRFSGNNSTVLSTMFEAPETLFRLYSAENYETNNRYLCWKTSYKASHVPEFTDKGIREQVVKAYKRQEGYKLAEQRASELAKQIRESEQPLEEVLVGQAVTGPEEGASLPFVPTQSFTWLEKPTVPPLNLPPEYMNNPMIMEQLMAMMRRPASVTDIASVEGGVDTDFMQTVFNEIQAGGVGVVPSADKSTVYVAKVRERDSEQELLEKMIEERQSLLSQSSQIVILTQEAQNEVNTAWVEKLEKKYQVTWVEPEERER